MPKFYSGQRVRLIPPDDSENLEEIGTILSDGPENDMWIVVVDAIYREDDEDDGLREVSTDQMREI